MTSHDRTYFDSLEQALAAWHPLSTSDLNHVRGIVRVLTEKVGFPHHIYIGQKDDAVAMSFGISDEVGLYLHPRRIDVAPKTVEAVGGRSELNALYPGFVQPPGQRSGFARLKLSS